MLLQWLRMDRESIDKSLLDTRPKLSELEEPIPRFLIGWSAGDNDTAKSPLWTLSRKLGGN
jgi:hypothetical protein